MLLCAVSVQCTGQPHASSAWARRQAPEQSTIPNGLCVTCLGVPQLRGTLQRVIAGAAVACASSESSFVPGTQMGGGVLLRFHADGWILHMCILMLTGEFV